MKGEPLLNACQPGCLVCNPWGGVGGEARASTHRRGPSQLDVVIDHSRGGGNRAGRGGIRW